MKNLGKSAIVLTIIFLVLIVSGGVLTALGGAKLATDADVWEKLEQVLGDMPIDFETGEILFGFSSDEKTDVSFETSVDVGEDVECITFENIVFEVDVIEGNDDQLKISYDGELPEAVAEEYGLVEYYLQPVSEADVVSESDAGSAPVDIVFNEGSIDIKFDYGTGRINGGLRGMMTIALPKGYDGTVEINESASELTINGVKLEALVLEDTAAEIDIENCEIGTLELRNTAGNISFEGKLECFNIENAAANVDIETAAKLTDDCYIENCVGNIEVNVPAGSGIDIDKENSLGNVMVNGENANSQVTVYVENCMGNFIVDIED